MQNHAVPDFQLAATGNTTFQLSQHLGKHIVLYFYPKDVTPEFFQAVYDEKSILFAGIKFEQERRQFLRKHYPERYKELFQ